MLHLIYGRAGYGKTHYVYEQIKKVCEQGEAMLLVPEQISFESEREMISVLGAPRMSRIQVLSFSRLCNRFFTEYGGKNLRCIDSVGKAVLLGQAIDRVRGELELYKKQCGYRAFRESLIDFFEQLKRAVVTPSQLMEQSVQCSGVLRQKLYELSLIAAEYDNALQGEYYDPLDDLTKMARMLPECRFFDGKTVFIDAFFGFTAQQLLVIERIIEMSAECYITLGCPGGSGSSGEMSLFANVEKTARRLLDAANSSGVSVAPPVHLTQPHRSKVSALCELEKNLFAPDFLPSEQPTDAVTICSAAGCYEEADYAARLIRRLVRTTDLRYREVAVIAGDISKYKNAFISAARRYNIPYYIDDRQEAAGCAIFKTAQYALQAVGGGLSNDDIISLLSCGISFADPEQVAALDDYTSIWLISGEQWQRPWTGAVSGLEPPREGDEQRLEQLNELRERIIAALLRLQRGYNSGNATEISTALYNFMLELECDKGLARFCEQLSQLGEQENAEQQRQSYNLFIRLISQLVMALGTQKLSGAEYYEYFCRALDETDIGALPQGLDEVAVGAADRMRPRRPRVSFILGANDTVFPRVYSSGGLLSEPELATLEQGGVQIPYYNVERAVDEQYLAYTAACSPSERLYISYQSVDSSGAALMPSPLVNAVREILPNCRVTHAALQSAEDIECEYDLAEYLAQCGGQSTERSSVQECLRRRDERAAELLAERAANGRHRLSPELSGRLFGSEIRSSASKINSFFECKYKFFCEYGIKVRAQRTVQVDALQKGTLIHFVLEQLIKSEQYTPEQLLQLPSERFDNLIRGLAAQQLEEQLGARELSRTEQYNLSVITATLSSAARRILTELVGSEFKPCCCELLIGGDEVQAIRFELPDGGVVSITGMIDRIDIAEHGGQRLVRILDYKSSLKSLRVSDIERGLNLQMLIYMMALRRSDSFADCIPAGILYVPIKCGSKNVNDSGAVDSAVKEIKRSEKMRGLVLWDEAALNALSPEGDYEFIPVIRSKEGFSAHSQLVTLPQFERLEQHITKKIEQMGVALHSGEIDARPEGGCSYCDYKALCGFDKNADDESDSSSEGVTTARQSFRNAIETLLSQYEKGDDEHGV